MMQDNFYQYQRKRTLILLAWGLGNVLGGVGGLLTKNKFWRQFWLQALSWGAIDAGLAGFGLFSQAKKLENYSPTQAQEAIVRKDINSFHKILFINIFLDVGYVLSGLAIRRWGKSSGRDDRQGIGVGFIVQGLFLFVYDLYLDAEVNKNWRNKEK